MNILIIDDSNQEKLKEFVLKLERVGHTVLISSDLDKAWNILLGVEIRVIFLKLKHKAPLVYRIIQITDKEKFASSILSTENIKGFVGFASCYEKIDGFEIVTPVDEWSDRAINGLEEMIELKDWKRV